ncbi:MAG: rod-binding protein [Solirubrobacteraceae bacterium]|nr:rod-binding protein [Solirubrobacteraceae bacterium]
MSVPGDLGPLPATAIPADVRRAGPQAERRYAAALSFERALMTELTKVLSAGALGEGETAATAAYRDMLPGTLADALTRSGGIGLAREVYDTLGGDR